MKYTLKRTSNLKRNRTHGFRRRMRTRGGRGLFARRRRKKRWRVSVA